MQETWLTILVRYAGFCIFFGVLSPLYCTDIVRFHSFYQKLLHGACACCCKPLLNGWFAMWCSIMWNVQLYDMAHSREAHIIYIFQAAYNAKYVYNMSLKVVVCVQACVYLCNVHGTNCVEYTSKAFSSVSAWWSDGVERVRDQIRIRENEWSNMNISKSQCNR